MCGCQRTRCEFYFGALGAAALGLTACARPTTAPADDLPPVESLTSIEVAAGLRVHPRSEWGADLPAAQDSLLRMLIFQADRYGIDTDPAATTTFVSRGSDKFRAGTTITTPTVSGHRDVTYTACPGDVGYTLLGGWRSRVHATRLMRSDPGPIKRAVRLNTHPT